MAIRKRTSAAARASLGASTQISVHKDNAILLGAVVIYLASSAPLLVLVCLDRASRPPYCSFFMTTALLRQMTPIANTILLCNYSLNFVMYCLVSRHFRGLVKETSLSLQLWIRNFWPSAKSSMGEHSSDSHLTPLENEVVAKSKMAVQRQTSNDATDMPVHVSTSNNQPSTSTSGRRGSPHNAHLSVRHEVLRDSPNDEVSSGAIEIHFKVTY